jgi:large subunit ribosomal protein L18
MKKLNSRYRSKIKIRKTISGTTERPRLTVYRSLGNIYAQLIDDTTGVTVAATSTLSKELKNEAKSVKGKIDKSKLVGKFLAEKALEKNIKNVVFDRNGYKYHGRVRAVAEGAREGGLQF